jgi:HYR domain-containing protein/galactose oxidase-like protein
MRRTIWAGAVIAVGILIAAPTGGAASTGGSFGPTGAMLQARSNHAATLLPDGKVLVVGGQGPIGGGYFAFLASAELYDSTTGQWTSTGGLSTAHTAPTATLLANGKVLVTGGFGGQGLSNPIADAELYDPQTATFTPTGSMIVPRFGHTATLLSNGRVLITGGLTGAFLTPVDSAELYDPISGTFSLTGSMSIVRSAHTAALLGNGKVLIAGGDTGAYTPDTATAELYDPSTGIFSPTGTMGIPRSVHSATRLLDGRVLIVGGFKADATPATEAEIYDPQTGTFAPTGRLLTAREGHTATLLSDGNVLVAGGVTVIGQYLQLASGELYDAATGTFTPVGDMSTARAGHTATLLSNGKVLVAGGGNGSYPYDLASADLFTFGDATPPVVAIPDDITTNATGPLGAVIAFSATATDDTDPNPTVTCTPPAGSTFPIGTTTVNCTASDAHGNTSSASFKVHVTGAAEQLADLLTAVTGVGSGTSLYDKVTQAQAALGANHVADACSTLNALVNQLNAQSGKGIPAYKAASLIGDATRIRAVLGC